LLRGSQEGSIAGLAGGLLLDLFSAVPYGMSGLVLGVLGLLTGFGEKSPARGHLVVLISTAVLGTIAFHGTIYLALQAMGWSLPNALMFARVVAPSALLNGLLMPMLFRLMRLLVQASAGGWRRLEL
jgi:rod shape-determining protein MreD